MYYIYFPRLNVDASTRSLVPHTNEQIPENNQYSTTTPIELNKFISELSFQTPDNTDTLKRDGEDQERRNANPNNNIDKYSVPGFDLNKFISDFSFQPTTAKRRKAIYFPFSWSRSYPPERMLELWNSTNPKQK